MKLHHRLEQPTQLTGRRVGGLVGTISMEGIHGTGIKLQVNSEQTYAQSPADLLLALAAKTKNGRLPGRFDQRILTLFESPGGVDWLAPRTRTGAWLTAERMRELAGTAADSALKLAKIAADLNTGSETSITSALRAISGVTVKAEVTVFDLRVGQFGFTYESSNLADLAVIEVILKANEGKYPRRCPACQMFFIPSSRRSQARFCDRSSLTHTEHLDKLVGNEIVKGALSIPGLRPCRYYETKKTPTGAGIRAEYRSNYQRLKMRNGRGLLGDDVMAEWMTQARTLLDIAITENWPDEQYKTALKGIEPG